ncbi:MAG: hypothetical protein IT433_11325 [Phycisphaerales bacterium]|nr:hypothetical protein [Phycisphaerales bacterium]
MQTGGSWKEGFGRRLAYYLIGIAIGLVLLGFLHSAKKGATQKPLAPPAASP